MMRSTSLVSEYTLLVCKIGAEEGLTLPSESMVMSSWYCAVTGGRKTALKANKPKRAMLKITLELRLSESNFRGSPLMLTS